MVKEFHLAALISVVEGTLIPTPGKKNMEDVYGLLNFMSGDNLFTHALPRAADKYSPEIVRQHPFLSEIHISGMNKYNYKEMLSEFVSKYGEFHAVNNQKGN